jgi:hypothetical protein
MNKKDICRLYWNENEFHKIVVSFADDDIQWNDNEGQTILKKLFEFVNECHLSNTNSYRHFFMPNHFTKDIFLSNILSRLLFLHHNKTIYIRGLIPFFDNDGIPSYKFSDISSDDIFKNMNQHHIGLDSPMIADNQRKVVIELKSINKAEIYALYFTHVILSKWSNNIEEWYHKHDGLVNLFAFGCIILTLVIAILTYMK